jgi:class 3 adenylate cyclase
MSKQHYYNKIIILNRNGLAPLSVFLYIRTGFSYQTWLTRQLAAIMFTDMVGYTALMQENEMLRNDERLIKSRTQLGLPY